MPKDDRPVCPDTGKVMFETWSYAAKRAKQLGRRTDAQMEPYHCRKCGGFHIAHMFLADRAIRVEAKRRKREQE